MSKETESENIAILTFGCLVQLFVGVIVAFIIWGEVRP